MADMEKTSDMTDEEAEALDEYFTRHLPKVDRSKGGVTTKAGFRMVSIDRLSENYIMTMDYGACHQ
ncbi:MAG: hypothetical protein LBT74_07640 [Acidobacteriota bacterium]|jgi:hypothetical protein|nr:hypothetical protein [Acidobacteriota bacterium]